MGMSGYNKAAILNEPQTITAQQRPLLPNHDKLNQKAANAAVAQ
jgi:hypothetical protein